MRLRDLFSGLGKRPLDPESLPVEGKMPEFAGIKEWINSPPLDRASLAGKTVLVDFWTYSCINCIRTLPYVNAWHKAYKDKGLVIIGVHTPEFEFEKDPANVKAAVARFGLEYPVALDNDYATWKAYSNRYWPAHYFIDGKANIRYHHFGEGGYEHSEAVIQTLLKEAGAMSDERKAISESIPQRTTFDKIGTPETYLGADRVEYLGSPESVRAGAAHKYSSAKDPAQNVFYLEGQWRLEAEYAVPMEAGAKIIYRFNASKANLVMDGGGKPHRVAVRLDGEALLDVTVEGGRLYELARADDYGSHLLELTFIDPGVKCYAFTFG